MNIENIEKTLNDIDLSIYDSYDNIKNTGIVMNEISNKWNKLTNKNKDIIINMFK